jgi:hypothetical protein
MRHTTWVRWTVATAVFLAIGWTMQRYGLNAARLALLALLILVYIFGGHGRQARAGVTGDPGAGGPKARTDPSPADGPDPNGP